MMQLMASAFTYPYRVIQDERRRNQMTKGYPITTEPFVPDIMKHKVEWKVIECKNGFRKIAFALAPEGSELVEPESLKMIRKKLCKLFSKHFIETPKELETTLPRNTIAVSFSKCNFDVGTSCQEVLPIEAYKTSEESFLTYQKLSENVQVTYFNHNGNQFLAGICYYPVPNGNITYLKNDSALIYLATTSSEDYPLRDRSKSFTKINYSTYGRYCKSSGKRVVVDCSGKYGAIVHEDYNHFTEKYECVKCMECLEDAATYKWEEPKREQPSPIAQHPTSPIARHPTFVSAATYKWEEPKNKQPSPVTRHPTVPDILKHTVHWETLVSKKGQTIIGFSQAAEGLEFATPECLDDCRKKLSQWLVNFPEFSKELEKALPRNTISISFSEPNFQVGKSCQDFLLLDKFLVPNDAFYTYQMISENLQATYLNENGIEYLAGICWYLPSDGKTVNFDRDLKLLTLVQVSAEHFPLQDRNKSLNKIKHNIYGRYCKTVKRRVAIDCSGKYGTIRHIAVNSTFNKYDYTSCEECLEDYFTYKWVEPIKESLAPINSTRPSEATKSSTTEKTVQSYVSPSTTTVPSTKNEKGADGSGPSELPTKEIEISPTTKTKLMASASTHPCRVVQDQIQKDQMTKGYPITSEPFVPDIMKHKIDWKVIKNKTGFRKIGFALAPEGSELVEPESLEMIRKKLCKVFSKYFIELPKELETTLPRNTIAVCYSVFNFDVGASCQEFSPIETFQTAEESFLTYQKLSENVQCTYYNQNGNQFLAGVCYYPVPNGHVMYLNNDSALIYLATASSEDYPLCDRSKSYRKVNYNMYGRYCKSSGKRVVVDCSGKYGAIVHVDYNHFTEKYEYVKCTECLEDAATYKWEQPKNETPAPLTRQPFVPDVLKHTVNWRTWVSKGGRPMIGFTEAVKGSEFSALECLEVCKNKLLQWLGNYPEFSEKLKEALPRNTIAISFSEPNFQLGKSCQDFLPLEKFKISDDGFYTYQMISKNVQATYYNENGVEFLAGICWYLPSNAKTISLNRDLKLMNMVGYSAEPFPLEDRNKSFTKIKNNIYGRYCKTAGRRVAIDCSGTYGTIRHIDVHSTFDKYDYTACEECLEDYFTYKWAEPTKEQPSPVTRHPTVPDTLRHAAHWKTWLTKAGVPKVGITQAADDLELAVPESLETCRDKLQRWLKNYPEFSKELETSLPRNTIAVSFAQYNFKVGKSCQEFLPSKQFKISDDAFYTYQMISKNMQATYYNENGVVFLAGICWYLPSNAKTINLNRDLKFIYLAQCSAEPFPLEDRNKSFTKIKNHIYGRYCKTAGRRVAIDCSGKNGTIRHIDVNSTYNKYEYTACEECLEDYFTYKWMESKKKNPASIDSPKPSEATESLTTEETVQSNISPSITTVSSTPTKEGPVLLDTPKPADSSTLLSDTAELSVATLSLEDKTSMSPASSTESLLKDFDKIEESATYDEEFDAEIIN